MINLTFFFNISLVPFLIFGICVFLLAKPLGNWQIKKSPHSFFSIPIINKIFIIWTSRAIGFAAICIFLIMGMNRPWRGMMEKEVNRLILLEEGKITEGKIVKRWYDDWAPSAWMVLYDFEISDPANDKAKTYWGSARGPKNYYANLSEGDSVSIIYYQSKPKINCEMYYFLNHPSYRKTFRETGKLELLNRFRDEYKFEDYSYMTWYDSAREK